MGQQIRILIQKTDGFDVLSGHIEADEAYVGSVAAAVSAGAAHLEKSSCSA